MKKQFIASFIALFLANTAFAENKIDPANCKELRFAVSSAQKAIQKGTQVENSNAWGLHDSETYHSLLKTAERVSKNAGGANDKAFLDEVIGVCK
jgi:hypothetical protein